MKMKVFIATVVATAMALPAMAFNVQWSGDLNNRFAYSNNADLLRLNALSNEAADYVSIANGGATGAVNTNISNRDKKDKDHYGETKYRIKLTASDDDKKVTGVVGFEMGGDHYGSRAMDFGGDSTADVELQYAYTKFQLPFDPAATLTLGLQPVGYNKWLWSDNAAGVKYAAKRGDFGYSVGWFRNDNDAGLPGAQNGAGIIGWPGNQLRDDVYAVDFDYKTGDTKLNAFYLYHEQGKETFAGATALDQESYLGASLDTRAGDLFLGGTFIYEFGEISFDEVLANAANQYKPFRIKNGTKPEDTFDREAFLVNLEGTMKVDDLKFTAGWLYASGDDDSDDDQIDNFNVIDMYTGGIGSVVIFDSYADDSTAVTSPYILDKGYNLFYLKSNLKLNDKSSVDFNYFYHNTAEDLANTQNPKTARKIAALQTLGYSANVAQSKAGGETEIGHELVVAYHYSIMKGLEFNIAAGYLFGGDLWDELGGVDSASGTQERDGDDVLRTDMNIRFKF